MFQFELISCVFLGFGLNVYQVQSLIVCVCIHRLNNNLCDLISGLAQFFFQPCVADALGHKETSNKCDDTISNNTKLKDYLGMGG